MSRTIFEVVYDENIGAEVIDMIIYPSDLIEIPLSQTQIEDIAYFDSLATFMSGRGQQK